MNPDGTLNWDVPAGKWTILRMGYSLVGSMNRAGTAGGLGLEVDKLNAKDVEAYFHGYMDPIQKELGPLLGKSLRYMVMDMTPSMPTHSSTGLRWAVMDGWSCRTG